MKKLEEIFSILGLNKDNGLYLTKNDNWKTETVFPNRVKKLLNDKIEPSAFFCFDNKPMILFFDNPLDKSNLYKKIWNFNECPIVIILEEDSVEIFNGFKYEQKTNSLQKLGGNEKLNDFTYFELVTGKTWEQYKEDLDHKNRVDYHLLQNIKAARKKLLVGKEDKNAGLVNALLGKVIFVRYLIDRKVKMKFDGKKTWTNKEFCQLLDNPKQMEQFFDYLQDKEKGFNGDLFPLSATEYKQIKKEDYQVLKDLLLGNDIETGQQSLFQLYDFSIIPIEFISNVYEIFIGKENQRKEGVFYTPLFLVDYILKETVEKHLLGIHKKEIKINKTNSGQSQRYSYCKVIDPACGSGIFLVETLRKIIEKYISETRIDPKSDSDKFKTAIKNLAKENIYGIDKDLSAVQVAIFSIYLTLLDYLEPPGIETFQFPLLLNTNFFEADFFDETATFNIQFNSIEFDFVLGNPPWKGTGMDDRGNEYLKNREKREKVLSKKYTVAINNNELVEGFVLRASDFCKKQTQVAFIIRSMSLYSLGYNQEGFSPFRQYLLEEYFIDRVFELAPVRHEVFEKSSEPAIAPAAVVFYRYANGENTNNNIVHHIALKPSRFFSLFKIFTINRTDFKKVQQSKLKEFDWLWKALVYGSYLDFNFIKRLKEEYTSIKEVISDEKKFVVSTGLHHRSNPLENPKDTNSIKGFPFLKTKAIGSFVIDYSLTDNLEPEKIDIIKDERIYQAPMLVARKGLDMATLTIKCAISRKNITFKDAITSIKPINAKSDALMNIASIFSSELFSYYSINTFASVGIEREQTQNYNKFSLPYIELDVKENIHKIEKATKEIHLEKENKKNKALIDSHKIHTLETVIAQELKKINKIIFQKLQVSSIESDLIDYSLQVSRTMITGNDKERENLFSVLPFKESFLEKYAKLYLNRFQVNLSNKDRKFIVEIWHTKQIIGMFFKVIPIKNYKTDIVWIDKQNSDLLSFLIQIGSQKITDQLFVQKDIRGFEKDYFYIFKPNEKRLWHKAIGHLDVSEFSDAILKAGREAK